MDDLRGLVGAARAGEPGAFERLIGYVRARAHAVALQWVRTPELAQDVVQEAFTEVYLKLPSLREPAAFITWFDRILVKHCDRQARARCGPDGEIAPEGALPGLQDGTGGIRGFVHEALAGLPEHQRLPLALYVADYSQAEIAALLQVPLTTVKKRFVDTRRQVRRRLEAEVDCLLRQPEPVADPMLSAAVTDLYGDMARLVGRGMGGYTVAALPVGMHPNGVAIHPLAQRLYVANSMVGHPAGSVWAIDTASHRVVDKLTVDRGPRYLAVDPARDLLYVSHYLPRTVWVIDGATLRPVNTVRLPGNPTGLAVDPVSGRVWVASMADADQQGTFAGVSLLEAQTLETLAALPVGSQEPFPDGPQRVCLDPLNHRGYVGGNRPSAVTIIDTERFSVTATVPTGRVVDVACNPNTQRVYASNHAGDRLFIVDGQAAAVVGSVEIGLCPYGLAVDSGTGQVFIGHSGVLSIFRDPPMIRTGVVPLSTACSLDLGVHGGVCLDPYTGTVYVSCQQHSVVYALAAIPLRPAHPAGSKPALVGLPSPN